MNPPRIRKRPASGTRNAINAGPYVPEAGTEPFPGYRLLRLRGRGGFATVWEAVNPAGERVALKFMSAANTSSSVTARELRSIQNIQKLDHPYLLRHHQVWSIPGSIVIGMDVADASLLDLFLLYADDFHTPIEPAKVGLYLFMAAEALDFLNARKHSFDGRTVGFQHGDVKPNNILLLGDKALLADYGLATPMHSSAVPCARQGTMEYAPPEVFAGVLADTSDQFSLAVTYYLLRTGAFPYPAPPKTVPKGYTRPAPDLTLLPEAERVPIYRALSPVPQARFPTCVEFVTTALKAAGLEPVRDMLGRLAVVPISALSAARSKLARVLRVDAAG